MSFFCMNGYGFGCVNVDPLDHSQWLVKQRLLKKARLGKTRRLYEAWDGKVRFTMMNVFPINKSVR
jgi:hypothetical protein